MDAVGYCLKIFGNVPLLRDKTYETEWEMTASLFSKLNSQMSTHESAKECIHFIG